MSDVLEPPPPDGKMTCELCGEVVDEIIGHLRVYHPDQYAEGLERWPDGEIVTIDDTLSPEDFHD